MLTVAVVVLLVVASSLVHYEGLQLMSRSLVHGRGNSVRLSILLLVLALALAHFLEVLLYASAYYGLESCAGGGLGPRGTADFWTCVYFSIETFTSLGFGDLLPSGRLRLVAGVEALNGLLLIGWSGSFLFITMQKFWRLEARTRHPPSSGSRP